MADPIAEDVWPDCGPRDSVEWLTEEVAMLTDCRDRAEKRERALIVEAYRYRVLWESAARIIVGVGCGYKPKSDGDRFILAEAAKIPQANYPVPLPKRLPLPEFDDDLAGEVA